MFVFFATDAWAQPDPLEPPPGADDPGPGPGPTDDPGPDPNDDPGPGPGTDPGPDPNDDPGPDPGPDPNDDPGPGDDLDPDDPGPGPGDDFDPDDPGPGPGDDFDPDDPSPGPGDDFDPDDPGPGPGDDFDPDDPGPGPGDDFDPDDPGPGPGDDFDPDDPGPGPGDDFDPDDPGPGPGDDFDPDDPGPGPGDDFDPDDPGPGPGDDFDPDDPGPGPGDDFDPDDPGPGPGDDFDPPRGDGDLIGELERFFDADPDGLFDIFVFIDENGLGADAEDRLLEISGGDGEIDLIDFEQFLADRPDDGEFPGDDGGFPDDDDGFPGDGGGGPGLRDRLHIDDIRQRIADLGFVDVLAFVIERALDAEVEERLLEAAGDDGELDEFDLELLLASLPDDGFPGDGDDGGFPGDDDGFPGDGGGGPGLRDRLHIDDIRQRIADLGFVDVLAFVIERALDAEVEERLLEAAGDDGELDEFDLELLLASLPDDGFPGDGDDGGFPGDDDGFPGDGGGEPGLRDRLLIDDIRQRIADLGFVDVLAFVIEKALDAEIEERLLEAAGDDGELDEFDLELLLASLPDDGFPGDGDDDGFPGGDPGDGDGLDPQVRERLGALRALFEDDPTLEIDVLRIAEEREFGENLVELLDDISQFDGFLTLARQ